MRVLVLEDDPLQISSFRRVFPFFGLELLAATTRLEALELVRTGIDAGIFDMRLPEQPHGGLDAAAFARKLRPDVPLVLHSGHDEQQVRTECRRLNVFYVIKPAPVQLLAEYLWLNLAARRYSGTREIVDFAATCERRPAMEARVLEEATRGSQTPTAIDLAREEVYAKAITAAAGNLTQAGRLLGVSRQAVQNFIARRRR